MTIARKRANHQAHGEYGDEDDLNQPETFIEFLTKIIDDSAKQNRFSIDKLKRLRRCVELNIKYRPKNAEAQAQSQQQ